MANEIDPSEMPGVIDPYHQNAVIDQYQSNGIDPSDMDPQSAIAAQGLKAGAQALGQNIQSQYQQGGQKIHQALGPLQSPETREALLGLGQQAAASTIGKGELPSDQASRMARAMDMGFDTDTTWYHGTPSGDIEEFDPHASPRDTSGQIAGFFTKNPKFANEFVERPDPSHAEEFGQNETIIPAHLKTENTFDYDNPKHVNAVIDSLSPADIKSIGKENIINNKPMNKAQLKQQIGLGNWNFLENPKILSAIKTAGHDSMNVYEKGEKNIAVFEPHQIRSKFAEFNPKKAKSGNISYEKGGTVQSPPTLNAMQYYPDGGVVVPPSEPTPQPQPTGIEGAPKPSPDLDPSDIPGAITTPQLPQAQGDQGIDPADQPGAITDPNTLSDEAKYGTPGQLALAGAEQFAQGIAGPALPAFEKYTGLSTPEAMRAREEQLHEQQPGVGETLKVAGTAASLGMGAGVLPLAGAAGEALASAAGLTKAAGLSAKVGAGALRGATEMGLLSAGDEVTKQIMEDPGTSTQMALMNVGLTSVLGAVGGGALGGIGALLSRGNAAKLVQEAENFKGQFQNRLDVPDPVTAMHEEQSARYNEIKDAYDNLYGAKGLKASVIAKTVPAQLTDKIIGEAQDNVKDFSDAISDMRKKPYHYPERLVNKLEADVQEANNVMFPTDGTQASPAQVFNAQQDLKQMAQSYAKYDKFIKPSDDAYDFVNKIKPLAKGLRESLEDPNVWGEAGRFQQNLNKAWSNMKPAFEGYEKYFTEKVPLEDPVTGNVSLENRSSLAKLNTYANQAGTFKDSAKKAYLKAFLDQSDKFAEALDDAHGALGEESPFTHSPMNVSRESLEELTPGMQLANAVVDQGLGKGAAHGLASGLGATAGGTLGGIFGGPVAAGAGATAGAFIGEKALGPLFAKSLPIIGKAFFNKVAEARGLRAFGQYVYRYAKGQELLSQSAKNVFKAGAEVLPVSAIPKVTHLAQLDKALKVAQNDPTQFANNLSNNALGSYMPGHAQSQAQMLGNVANYVNSQRPDTSKKAPLDSNRTPSQVVQGAFNNLLGIAQQPLSVMPKIKNGTLTPDDVKHLNAMYPAAWASMQKEISNAMAAHIAKGGHVPYKTRVGLSIFTGQPMDSTFTPQAIQAAQPQGGQPQAQQAGAPKQGKKSSTKDLHKIGQDALTPSQARQKAQTETE